MKYLVMFSAGATSWASAMRMIERHGRENVEALFADTKIEDPDAYRFLDEAEKQMGIKLHRIADGRDVWEVFVDSKFIGNTRVDICSRVLKRELMKSWMEKNFERESTVLVYGLDWSERTRIDRHRGRMKESGWACEYPMDEKPYLIKKEVFEWMRSEGVEPPRLYALGFDHNNCGGMCVKMGMAQARHLLRTLPETWAYHEQREADAMTKIGKTAKPFLRFRTKGRTRGVTMAQFRKIIERQPLMFEDHGGGVWWCMCN
jgi:hypothetical protein